MKILFIGGTGTISTSCLSAALSAGHDVTILCRGTRNERAPKGVNLLQGDAYQLEDSLAKKISRIDWDCVVNWTLYTPSQAELDIQRFHKNTKRYFFISSTSVYDGSNQHNRIIESQNYLNSNWSYSKSKIESEKIFLHAYATTKFPVTIVRPGHTYNDFTIPTNIQGFGYGLIKRINENKNVLMHDDGNSLWTLTHSNDFAKFLIQLFDSQGIEGETLHVANENYHSWNEIYSIYADLIGKKINKVNMSHEDICAKSLMIGEPIMSDKRYNRIFDVSKLKKYIKDFKSDISLNDGLLRVLEWYRLHPENIYINEVIEKELIKLGI